MKKIPSFTVDHIRRKRNRNNIRYPYEGAEP